LIHLLRNAALVLLGLVIFLAVAGATYQSIATRAEARRSPEAGRLVDVGGYRLKINCTGKGSPTVVLEAGLSDVSVEWKHVQPEIARFSRVCSASVAPSAQVKKCCEDDLLGRLTAD
jgi:hypothetical protein